MNNRIGAILLALPLSAGGMLTFHRARVTASAGIPSYCEGVESCGLILKETSAVEVEKELLTLRIGDLPRPESGQTLADYHACVESEYTFYNPTASDAEMTVLLPLGGEQSPSSGLRAEGDLSRYRIETEGEAVEPMLRHTLRTVGFDLELETERIAETRREDDFFSEETPVTVYTYRFERETVRARDYFHLELDCNPARSRVLFGGNAKTSIADGRAQGIWQSSEPQGVLCAYVFGEPAISQNFTVTSDAAGTMPVTDVTVFPCDETQTNFSALAEMTCAEGVDVLDWYNGFVDMLNAKSQYGVSFVPLGQLTRASFTRWYEYTLTVPAGGRLTSSVIAPLYPSVDLRSTPVYRYSYLLSSAQRWSALRSLEIVIETPFYLKESSLVFEKGEEGYTFRRDGLPFGELTFSLTETEPKTPPVVPYGSPIPTIALAGIALGVLFVCIGISVTIMLIVFKRRERKYLLETGRLNRGVPTQGKIPPDDPPKKK